MVFAICMLDLPVGIAANVHLGYAAKVARVRCGVGCKDNECCWCCGLLELISNMVSSSLRG